MSLNISLPPELEARVRRDVESGRFNSVSELVGEALRMFDAYEDLRAAKLAGLRTDVAQGLADVAAGRVAEIDLPMLKQRAQERLAKGG